MPRSPLVADKTTGVPVALSKARRSLALQGARLEQDCGQKAHGVVRAEGLVGRREEAKATGEQTAHRYASVGNQ